MSRKSESSADKSPKEEPVAELVAFNYPTIGDGITIQAKNQKEADAVAAKIKESLSPTNS